MSLADYVIICDGRIDVAIASNGFHRIRAASRTATELLKFYGDRLTKDDVKPISTLQHDMMDLVSGRAIARSRQQPLSADEMVDEMFAHLDALEQKMKSY